MIAIGIILGIPIGIGLMAGMVRMVGMAVRIGMPAYGTTHGSMAGTGRGAGIILHTGMAHITVRIGELPEQ